MKALQAAILEYLRETPLGELAVAFVLQNLIIALMGVGVGHLFVRAFRHRRITDPAPPLTRAELAWAGSAVFLNGMITLAGLVLWRAGWIVFRTDIGVFAWLDVVVLLMVMDTAMYFLHRIAHHRWLYSWMHATHHVFDRPRPMDLFVLNPFEALGFGGLWLTVITLYSSSWLGMSIYLALNVAFGTFGHMGVEAFPRRWLSIPGLNWIAPCTFHAQHHQAPDTNYGFYTVVWDRLFNTINSDYASQFETSVAPRPFGSPDASQPSND